ncbi:MAG: bifunctional nicotinamidase/pyrazinamidase [Thermoguttaceae bacterium]|jgi:nicotinamidase/pyrazinamidase|nr:bifunctional nicotinamidase/pyrazinamidase [Thermoguttaceae bacterium]
MNVLILTDLQNDFCPGGALAVPEGDVVIPLANRLQQCFDLVVATQDWHPADHGSFAANHPGREPGDVIELGGLQQVLWPVHCVQSTSGAELHPDLDTSKLARVFRKGTDPQIDSYSCFFDNGHRKSTGLCEYLKQEGVTDVYLCGLALDYCVKFSALDAVAQGFTTWLIEDACRGIDREPGDIDRAIEQMRQEGVRVVRTKELIQ